MRTLCRCIFSFFVSTFGVFCGRPAPFVSCPSTVANSALAFRRRRRRPMLRRLARDCVSDQPSPQKRSPQHIREPRAFSSCGHNATGPTRPYRDPLLAKIFVYYTKTPIFPQGGSQPAIRSRFVIIVCTRSKKTTFPDMARSSNTEHRGKIGACATCHENLKPNT